MYFIRDLRHWIQKNSSKNVVYFDESGFDEQTYRPHGWAKRGVKVFGKITGNVHRPRTNLIMAQRGKQWIAPMTFKGICDKKLVLEWIKKFLLKELNPNSLVIMDNAPFHNKNKIREILEDNGHTLMPLPTYSPDLNPIEKSFAIIKRRRQKYYQSVDDIIMSAS